MYIRTIVWTRPSKDVEWPWIGLNDEYLAACQYEPGLINMSSVSDDTTFTQTVVWEDEQYCLAHAKNPVTVALQVAQTPIMLERGITKTTTDSTVM